MRDRREEVTLEFVEFLLLRVRLFERGVFLGQLAETLAHRRDVHRRCQMRFVSAPEHHIEHGDEMFRDSFRNDARGTRHER